MLQSMGLQRVRHDLPTEQLLKIPTEDSVFCSDMPDMDGGLPSLSS